MASQWFNLVTLVLSVTALIISAATARYAYEANEIARMSATASLALVQEERPPSHRAMLHASACTYRTETYTAYWVLRNHYNNVAIVNNGGQAASLMEVRYQQEDRHYSVSVYQPSQGADTGEPIELPIDIAPGTGRILSLQATSTEHFSDMTDAVAGVQEFVGDSHVVDTPLVWEFEFSNGTVLKETYNGGWYSVAPEIETFKYECVRS